jgi:DNA repair exonuclease SbcCD ATPase subunit
LEREIRQAEEKLAEMRARVARERWAPPKVGRLSRNARSRVSEERLRSQIRSLETRLNYLRQERSETYAAGRRAGFLPGELDGKGILP